LEKILQSSLITKRPTIYNGNHLLELVQECELIIANTHFQKKRGKLWT